METDNHFCTLISQYCHLPLKHRGSCIADILLAFKSYNYYCIVNESQQHSYISITLIAEVPVNYESNLFDLHSFDNYIRMPSYILISKYLSDFILCLIEQS